MKLREWSERRLRKLLGRVLSRQGEDGHNLLCRFNKFVCHYGPHGTFCYADCHKLDAGGHICTFGTACGEPTESYMRQMHEQLEQFHRISAALEKSGGMVSFVMENPRFSSTTLCDCGQNHNPRLPEHAPLCPYRIEHDFPVSVDEYREAIAPIN